MDYRLADTGDRSIAFFNQQSTYVVYNRQRPSCGAHTSVSNNAGRPLLILDISSIVLIESWTIVDVPDTVVITATKNAGYSDRHLNR
jgi:hypothetical protein